MEYKIVKTIIVNDFLSDGWELYGYPVKGEAHFFQAVTRSHTERFKIITWIEGEWNDEAEKYKEYGYHPIGKPQKTGKFIEVASEKLPEFAVILMKRSNYENEL